MSSTFSPYTTSEEVLDVVRRFESCNFPPDGFHHSHHVTVAMSYLLTSSEADVVVRMRTGLLRFLAHHGKDGAYHETITVFWIKRVKQLLDVADNSQPLVDLANAVVTGCSDSKLIDLYFSDEKLKSDEARRSWVDPDLQPLEDNAEGVR